MWSSVEGMLQLLKKAGGPFAMLYQQAMLTGMILTTSYSGLGTIEVAAGMLSEGFRQEHQPNSPAAGFHCYAACDMNTHCQQALLEHRREQRPLEEC